MTADLRALIEAVEADTATGGRDALAVPADMSALIRRVVGDDDLMWFAFIEAHDGCLSEAVKVVAHLLPGWTWAVYSDGEAVVADVDWLRETHGNVPDNPARALLLAALRAKLGEADHG
jgi:hypothetical protein